MDPVDGELARRAREIFREILERESGAWDAFLDQACAGDEPLRREVESLLEYDRQAGGILDQPAVAMPPEEEAGDPWIGRRIGPYQVLNRLGRGGMGVVYLALRVDREFSKQVALKLLRPGLESEDVVQRFRAERQILAALDHPNIAQLLDGGSTEDGLPYLVMEYVEGQPIAESCDRRDLALRERIELFLTVCSAVHFAHQNLVVHRDLKPGNILVTPEGHPKLLDFGIAKLLDPEPASGLTPTVTGQRMMTPDYASPEQVRGEPISTASDVYSLGVLLYELLTGRRPYRLNSESPVEVLRLICEQEPQRPSIAVLSEPESSEAGPPPLTEGAELPARPEVARRRLRRRLAGDLDNIVLMAMRKEPRHRYASVEQLAADLKRYLDGRPVSARKATLRYRCAKFVRRNRWAVAALAALVAASLGFGVVMGMQRAEISRERDLVAEERNRAEKVTEFLIDLFEVADPSRARGETLTAPQILEAGSRKLAFELEDQPRLRATLMDTVGMIYLKIGLYDDARPLLQSALETRRQLLGEDPAGEAESLQHVAELGFWEGDLDAAESLFGQALAMQRGLFGDDHPEVAESLTGLGRLLNRKGDYAAAEPVLREALAMRRRLFGDEHLEVAESLQFLGGLLVAGKSDFAAAEPLLREALATHRKLLGPEDLTVAATLTFLGQLVFLRGDHQAAEPMYWEALEIRRKLLGDEHLLVAHSLNNLANTLRYSKPDAIHEVEQLLRQSLEIYRLISDEYPTLVIALSNLGITRYEMGDYDKAEEYLRESLALCRKLQGDRAPQMGIVRTWLAETLIARGDPVAGDAQVQEALGILRQSFPEEHWWVLHAQSTRAAALIDFERYPEAERLLLDSYPKLREKMGERDPLTRRALDRVIHLYEAWGRPDKAAEYRARPMM